MPHMTNHRDAVFVITPKLNFELHKEYQQTLKEYNQLVRKMNFRKVMNENLYDQKQDFEIRLETLKDSVMKEKEFNNQTIQKSQGMSYLNYGNQIQLMHKDSGYFISAMRECSQTRQIGYAIELTDWYSELMIFKMLPKFKSREIGDIIQAKESVLIQNCYNSCYINFIYTITPYFNDLSENIDLAVHPKLNKQLDDTGSPKKQLNIEDSEGIDDKNINNPVNLIKRGSSQLKS